jgi:hypothetical protein
MRQTLIGEVSEVIEKMERETGFEPATSSLGISASIDFKGHGVHGGDTDPWSFSNLRRLLPKQPLNGVEMEGKAMLQFREPSIRIAMTVSL